MRHTTYSFLDLGGVIMHPMYAGGPFQFTGEGTGNVTVSMSTDRSHQDIAADGSIMLSKIAGNNGQIQIECQQTSAVHKYLTALYGWLITEGSEKWGMMSVALRNAVHGNSHFASGVSFVKLPDESYQAQGQKVTWVLMAADIVKMPM